MGETKHPKIGDKPSGPRRNEPRLNARDNRESTTHRASSLVDSVAQRLFSIKPDKLLRMS